MRKKRYTKRNAIEGNLPYLAWTLFYFLLFWLALGANAISFIALFAVYLLLITFAFTPVAESFWRVASGVRPLRTSREKERLEPLLDEVYEEVKAINPDISKAIKLYIFEDMEINAFAFGRGTLVLTRGSILLLNDECLQGLIAHEFGHFAHYDTHVQLIVSVGNLFVSLLFKLLNYLAKSFKLIALITKPLFFINDCLLMSASRHQEYMADEFALHCRFDIELIAVLYQLYDIVTEKPESVREQLRRTHPELTKRIENLERLSS